MKATTTTATKPVRNDDDRIDRLTTLTIQLSALTSTLYGSGLESFMNKSNEVTCGVLWLVHDLADEIRSLSEQVDTMCEVEA
jgi:hypothetical protein